jgi:nitronate monooxygenase
MALPEVLRDSLRLPIIGSPMFIVSGPELVIAQCKAGIVGAFPALNARPQAALGEWITRIKDELAAYAADNPGNKVAPFAVNQICHATNERLRADVETCVEHQVPIIITSLRPPEDVVKAVHSYGGVVFHDIISQRHAEKAAEQGVDGLILVCAGAGGHAGPLSPFALLREVKEWFDGTIILSGAISDGWCVASARALGADLAYMGSRFIATEEANAQPAYKQMLIDSAAKDVIYTPFFTGIAGSYLKPSIAAAGLDPDALSETAAKDMNFAGREEAEAEAKAWVDIWGSGQGIGTIHDNPPVAELVDRIEAEYGEARAQLAAR